jgi:hypothetical protein
MTPGTEDVLIISNFPKKAIWSYTVRRIPLKQRQKLV